MGWLNKLFNLDTYVARENEYAAKNTSDTPSYGNKSDKLSDKESARIDAKKRLKLVLMHDRTQLSGPMLDQMRDELVEVISRYVEIDREALDINLESESNTIALVANIPVVRALPSEEGDITEVRSSQVRDKNGYGEKKAASTAPTPTKPAPKKEAATTTRKDSARDTVTTTQKASPSTPPVTKQPTPQLGNSTQKALDLSTESHADTPTPEEKELESLVKSESSDTPRSTVQRDVAN